MFFHGIISGKEFLGNLKFVVIDEAHKYRGVFGSNVAFLIRRFQRICNYYGSNPQFILSTATLANPKEFSEKLVGLKFNLISKIVLLKVKSILYSIIHIMTVLERPLPTWSPKTFSSCSY